MVALSLSTSQSVALDRPGDAGPADEVLTIIAVEVAYAGEFLVRHHALAPTALRLQPLFPSKLRGRIESAGHGAGAHGAIIHLCCVSVGAPVEVVLLCVRVAEVLPLQGVLRRLLEGLEEHAAANLAGHAGRAQIEIARFAARVVAVFAHHGDVVAATAPKAGQFGLEDVSLRIFPPLCET